MLCILYAAANVIMNVVQFFRTTCSILPGGERMCSEAFRNTAICTSVTRTPNVPNAVFFPLARATHILDTLDPTNDDREAYNAHTLARRLLTAAAAAFALMHKHERATSACNESC